jgi:hypothetical protein
VVVVDCVGSFLHALLQHLPSVAKELEQHISNVLVALDDVVVDKVSLRFVLAAFWCLTFVFGSMI